MCKLAIVIQNMLFGVKTLSTDVLMEILTVLRICETIQVSTKLCWIVTVPEQTKMIQLTGPHNLLQINYAETNQCKVFHKNNDCPLAQLTSHEYTMDHWPGKETHAVKHCIAFDTSLVLLMYMSCWWNVWQSWLLFKNWCPQKGTVLNLEDGTYV